MNGLLRRFVQLLRSFLAPAEDPRQTFGCSAERQRELLEQLRRALADMAVAKQRLETRMAEVRRKLPELEEQAQRALAAGRDDVARLALRRRQLIALEAQRLEDQAREVGNEAQRLALVEQRLAARVEAYFARKELLAARHNAARAQVRINEALTGLSREMSDLGLELAKAEQETEGMEARALVIDRLIEDGIVEVASSPTADPLVRQFAQADVAAAVEENLADLKGRLDAARLRETRDQ